MADFRYAVCNSNTLFAYNHEYDISPKFSSVVSDGRSQGAGFANGLVPLSYGASTRNNLPVQANTFAFLSHPQSWC